MIATKSPRSIVKVDAAQRVHRRVARASSSSSSAGCDDRPRLCSSAEPAAAEAAAAEAHRQAARLPGNRFGTVDAGSESSPGSTT